VLLPSDREGFGLPLIEAMACGTPVVASGIPALREIGGDAAAYCAPGDVWSWVETVTRLLDEKRRDPDAWQARREACVRQASRFDWKAYATQMTQLYRQVAES
jgi:glycosyltransferase involved in cell wall biosynthesis